MWVLPQQATETGDAEVSHLEIQYPHSSFLIFILDFRCHLYWVDLTQFFKHLKILLVRFENEGFIITNLLYFFGELKTFVCPLLVIDGVFALFFSDLVCWKDFNEHLAE